MEQVVTRPTPRAPGLFNTGVALAMTALLAAVALTVRQPPPPAIAEFAPQAVEQIKEAPTEQTSEFGSASGAGEGTGPTAGDAAVTTTTTTPEESENRIEIASVRQCVGNPPRQTEDPQSPPCVAFFEGDNGGATAPGVTADTINIGVPAGFGAQVNPDFRDYVTAAFAHFNQRYEFYGRRLIPKWFTVSGGQGGAQRPAQRSNADTAKENDAFASTSILFAPGYYERLVEHKIIGTYRTPDYTDSHLAANGPYLWGYVPSSSQIQAGLADWACNRLVGRKARYAGMAGVQDLTTQDRKFGIIMQIPDEASPNRIKPLKDALEACGADVVFTLEDFGARASSNQGTVNNTIIQMQDAGVTSVFMLVEATHAERYHNSASSQRYVPEWLISSYPTDIWTTSLQSRNEEQTAHTFGLMFRPMERVPEDHPSTWAALDGGKRNPGESSTEVVGGQDTMYRDLLVLASGIQMAGPNLTPETFRDGLRRAHFPNPPHPIMAGKVGFNEGDYGMLNDAVEVWWNNDASGPYVDTPDGALCYMNGGARRSRGSWDQGDDGFFEPEGCDYGTRPVS